MKQCSITQANKNLSGNLLKDRDLKQKKKFWGKKKKSWSIGRVVNGGRC